MIRTLAIAAAVVSLLLSAGYIDDALGTGVKSGYQFGSSGPVVATHAGGEVVPGDFATALLAESILAKEPGAKVIYDVRASWAVPETISAAGGTPLVVAEKNNGAARALGVIHLKDIVKEGISERFAELRNIYTLAACAALEGS